MNFYDITEITIPASITWIGEDAFTWAERLEKVHVSDLVAWCQIDFKTPTSNPLSCENAELYLNGDPVTELVIPGEVTSISNYAFNGCNTVTSVIISEGVTSIGDSAFTCANLTDVTIPSTVNKLDESFYAPIKNVYIEDLTAWCEIDFSDSSYSSVLAGAEALYVKGSKVTYLTIPRGTTKINDYAFYDFGGITCVEIPSSVTEIGRCAFLDCPNLTYFYVWAENPNYKAFYGPLFSKDSTKLLTYPAAMSDTTYTIPNTVTTIGDGAFRCCQYLKNVIVGDNVNHIGMTAFYNCKALESISIGTGIQSIDQVAFYRIPTLKKVEIKDLATWCQVDIAWDMTSPFENGAALYIDGQPVTNLVIPDGVKSIGKYAFSGCASIQSVTIPEGVESIGTAAFHSCSNLETVDISDGVKTIKNSAFNKCDNLKSIILPGTIESIGDNFCNSSPVIWFTGTEEEFNAIQFGKYGNNSLMNTTWHYDACSVGAEHIYDHDCDIDCDVCGEIRTIQHQYYNNCDSDCNVEGCGFIREIGDHVYDHGCDTDCNECGNVRVTKHNFDNACDAVCNVKDCGFTREVGDHVYDHGCDTDCNECGNIRVTEHKYTDSCDRDCNTCGALRTTKHTYSNDCDNVCNVCGDTRITEHKFDNACDAVCNVEGCGFTREVGNHVYDHGCDTDCNECDDVRVTEHTYTDSCDRDCNDCNNLRSIEHTYINDCDNECDICGHYRKTEHSYETIVKKATLSKNGYSYKKCSVCGVSTTKTTIYKASKVSLSKTSYTYNGKAQKPSVVVKNSKGKTISSKYYTVTYASGRKNVGTYKVTVKMKGNYSGTKTLYFKVNPVKTTLSTLTAGKKALTVKWTKKTAQVTGYQIQYSTSKSFKSYKTKTISKNSTTSTKLTGLSAKKTYYVRIRTYKTVNGVKYYSGWSTVKSKKTK